MARKPKEVDFTFECEAELEAIRKMVGKPVPLTARYVTVERPILVAIENDLCTLRFPSGAILERVPIRDLVDDLNYWRLHRT